MIIVIDARDALLKRVGVAVYAQNVIQKIIDISKNDDQLIIIGVKGSECPFALGKNCSYRAIAPGPDATLLQKIWWYYSLPRVLNRLDADVYFGHYTKLPMQSKCLCPIVTTVHDAASINTNNIVGTRLGRLFNLYFVKGLVCASSRIICISNYCKKEFGDIFGKKFLNKSVVVYHGLPDDFMDIADRSDLLTTDVSKKFSIRNKYIVAVGTVTPKKNYTNLIRAFAEIDDRSMDLVIIGAYGYGWQSIVNEKEQSHLGEHVHFTGALDTVDMCDLMRGADCFVFPSYYEGFGIPLLEAFYIGTPIACSNATCLPEIVGSAALLFDPENVSDIKEQISKIIYNQKIADELVRLGKKRVSEFSWLLSAQMHLKVIKEAAAGGA